LPAWGIIFIKYKFYPRSVLFKITLLLGNISVGMTCPRIDGNFYRRLRLGLLGAAGKKTIANRKNTRI
jgi:hypothetical protein